MGGRPVPLPLPASGHGGEQGAGNDVLGYGAPLLPRGGGCGITAIVPGAWLTAQVGGEQVVERPVHRPPARSEILYHVGTGFAE